MIRIITLYNVFHQTTYIIYSIDWLEPVILSIIC